MPRRLLFWGFRPAEEVHGLGTLERQVLDVVWRLGRASVRDVLTAVDHAVAYTTAMTVMDRLFKKGVLDRERVGRAYVYSAAASSEQLQSSLVMGLLQAAPGAGTEGRFAGPLASRGHGGGGRPPAPGRARPPGAREAAGARPPGAAMMFYAFGAAVVLATFALVNALVSFAVMGLAPAG
jgi:predicted transcriptional regulator